MHKILALWATPRSTSTAFEWMMRMRGDMACFHEPFGEPWYQGEDPLWPRLKADSPRTPGLTFDSVWQTLRDAAKKGPVFSKDFPHYIEHFWDDEFLSHFNHSFLIRDPAKVATSMYKHWPDFVLKEIAFVEQRHLFDRLCDHTGEAPPVVDSDDLLENPHDMIEAYCHAVRISFMPEALHWESGARDEVSWYDGGSWHTNLRDSDGLKPQPRSYIDISEAPDRVKEIYELCLPHYERLYAYRLRTEQASS
ncbi:MAG: sulfotransferase family protein [Gammaproteobacteria bacterium]|nr:sulfotransferase family protein [Gammaproteobacteria bacterium]MCZ6578900.1 sulfotransferase family protein [Gammaproteobacteria bacterium]MCZ6798409.1 sulfotransferase family protein [Gammaproteobacteria bacterium]MCZ6882937.1 sulfotransferase family protein [Gammaproteobacteria bacterium]